MRGEYNINTAGREMLRELFNTALSGGIWTEGNWEPEPGRPSDGYWSPGYWNEGAEPAGDEYFELIENIIYYRLHNPFNTVSELKFVRGMTKEIFDKIRKLVTVSTNLATASAKELCTLGDISRLEVNRILKYREKSKFISEEDFFDSLLITAFVFDQIENFIDFVSVDELDVRYPDMAVNINGASEEDMTTIGLRPFDIERIEFWLKSGYTFKSYGEVALLLGFNEEATNAFEDNIVLSDLPFYYFEGININTATAEQLRDLGFIPAQINAVRAMSGAMLTFYDIPGIPGLTDFNEKITLYTNINSAGRAELESVFTDADASLIGDIINYRNDQPFGSYEEIYEFFVSAGFGLMFDAVRGFIVIR